MEPLTHEQRRLVRENIGLVAVHLRRHVSNLAMPRRDREWEDLFQEGCLGLIKAAVAYRKERGIAFAAFALPRIHNAVSRALQSKFSTVHVPPKRSVHCGVDEATAGVRGGSKRPKVHSLSGELGIRLRDRRRHDPHGVDGETIGDRLRSKYERAVRGAGEALSTKPSTRGDRDRLVRVLMEERLLVPHEESRRALRQIARDTHSSYARVAQCDKQLIQAVRSALEADPEFCELKHRARSNPHGPGMVIDDDLERDLAAVSADEFLQRFRGATTPDRARMLDVLLQMPDSNIDNVLHARVLRLPGNRRELLLRQVPEAKNV